MGAEGFGTLARLVDDRPVVTYDPRNIDRSSCTAGLGIGKELVTIKVLAAQGEEQLACSGLPAVGRHARERNALADQASRHRFRGGGEVHGDAHNTPSGRAARAALASARSEKGRLTPAIS